MSNEIRISTRSKNRLKEQGFRSFTDSELGQYRFGIRFAYFTCMSLVIIGLAFKSQPFLLIANAVALLGMLPPYHPLDYIYNYAIRHLVNAAAVSSSGLYLQLCHQASGRPTQAAAPGQPESFRLHHGHGHAWCHQLLFLPRQFYGGLCGRRGSSHIGVSGIRL
jgi:hypothetical protein